MRHENTGRCRKCQEILGQYPGLHPALRIWFGELQAKHPEAHCSCAGRGSADQAAKKAAGLSRADWGKSSHNWNAGLDLFEMSGDIKEIYEREWFERVVEPAVRKAVALCGVALTWYGYQDAEFRELPHVELTDWRRMAKNGFIKLVE